MTRPSWRTTRLGAGTGRPAASRKASAPAGTPVDDDVAARAREGHVGAEHVHAQALEEGGRNSLRDEHHDVVAVHPDAERGEKAALRGAVARIADFVGEARDGVRKLAVQERDGVLARDAHQTVFGDAAAGAVVVRANRPASSPASAVVQALALQFIVLFPS